MDHPAATAAPQDIETGHGTRLNDVSGGDGEVAAEAHHPSAGLDNVLDVSLSHLLRLAVNLASSCQVDSSCSAFTISRD